MALQTPSSFLEATYVVLQHELRVLRNRPPAVYRRQGEEVEQGGSWGVSL